MKEPSPSPRLPWIVKITIALTFFNSWVIFEETVVDRHGLWRYMPLYRVGLFCTWDVLALGLIIAAILCGIGPTRRAFLKLLRRLCFLADCRYCQ